MKISLSSVQWGEFVVGLMLCPLEWTLDCLHLEEGFIGGLWKDCVWGLNAVQCLPVQSVRLVSCENTCWVLACHRVGRPWELTCGLFLSNRSSSCGGLLTLGLSMLILSPCSHPSVCGIWAESSPPCSWKGGWSLLQTSSGTLLHFLKQNAAKEGRLRRLQWCVCFVLFFFSGFSSFLSDVSRAVLLQSGELRPCTINVLLLIPKENQIPFPPVSEQIPSAKEAKALLSLHDAPVFPTELCWSFQGSSLGQRSSLLDCSLMAQNLLKSSACIFNIGSERLFSCGGWN